MKITSSDPIREEPIPWARPAIDDAELNEVVACMKSGWLTSGPRVDRFEQEMARRAQRRFAIAVSNGTAALDVALKAVDVLAGDEVIVPAFSYVATATSVALQGATPVFADVDRWNLGLDAKKAADCVTQQTRAILTTDHGGNPCNYAGLTQLAKAHNIPLIVDGAQSIGTMSEGKPALSYGLISTTSFHAAKTMTTIEGGMVFTDDPAIARRMRIIRSQGEDPQRKYHHIELGHNFRMTELQAAIGLAQLDKLDGLLSERLEIAGRYDRLFTEMGLPVQCTTADPGNSFFLYSVRVGDRDEVMARLKQRGIDTRACYPVPLYHQPILRRYARHSCPVSEQIAQTILNPPMFHGITEAQQRRVAAGLRDVLREIESPVLRKAV